MVGGVGRHRRLRARGVRSAPGVPIRGPPPKHLLRHRLTECDAASLRRPLGNVVERVVENGVELVARGAGRDRPARGGRRRPRQLSGSVPGGARRFEWKGLVRAIGEGDRIVDADVNDGEVSRRDRRWRSLGADRGERRLVPPGHEFTRRVGARTGLRRNFGCRDKKQGQEEKCVPHSRTSDERTPTSMPPRMMMPVREGLTLGGVRTRG